MSAKYQFGTSGLTPSLIGVDCWLSTTPECTQRKMLFGGDLELTCRLFMTPWVVGSVQQALSSAGEPGMLAPWHACALACGHRCGHSGSIGYVREE
jgi:hypothetical protein